MTEDQKNGLEIARETEREAEQDIEQEAEQETVQAGSQKEMKSSGGSIFTGIYDQLPNISVKSVDRFILICIIAFVAVILIGVLKANHVF